MARARDVGNQTRAQAGDGVAPALTPQQWAARIDDAWDRFRGSAFDLIRLLWTANAELDAVGWDETVALTKMRPSTIRKLLIIAKDERIIGLDRIECDPGNTPSYSERDLPGEWTTLYELSTLTDPEWAVGARKGLIRRDMVRTDVSQIRALIQADENKELALRGVDLPAGKYHAIVIDPPWPQQKIVREVRPNQVDFDYPTLTLEQLSALDVASFAADHCHLWLWSTIKFLPEAFNLVDDWGFRYVNEFVWHKPGGMQPRGMQQYNHEPGLYCRKGSPKFLDTTAFPTCFSAPRREHSRKPDAFYDTVRRVCAGPRLDMFSREPRDGFDQHGNQPGLFVPAAAE